MQKEVFLPKYTLRGLWDVLLLSLGGFSVLIIAIWRQGFGIENILFLIALVSFCFWWMHLLVRRIDFNHSTFSVARFLSPTKSIDYVDITDIGLSRLKTKKGEVSFAGMRNTQELLRRFVDLIEQGKIEKEQLAMKIVVEEEIWAKSNVLTAIFSFLFCALLLYKWPFYGYWFSSMGVGISAGLIIFIVGSVVQRIQRARLKKEDPAEKA